MASSGDTTMKDATTKDESMEDATIKDSKMKDDSLAGIHEPFTVEENISQLNAVDKLAVQLMRHTATALNSLTTPASSDSTSNASTRDIDASTAKDAFQKSTDSFLTALHDIDVRMKRQIMALEEAGIVDLGAGFRNDPSAQNKASLRPNGLGAVGNLDVGWLNSRSTKVERDMEAELWHNAKSFLESRGDELKSD